MGDDTQSEQTTAEARAQGEIFLSGEADRWFERNLPSRVNEHQQPAADVAYLLDVLAPHRPTINSVLEIGCCDGLKLNQLCKSLDATGCGIDPSEQAVAKGNTRFGSSGIELVVGLAQELPYADHSFDLVYFGFCLYLVDRHTLAASLREAHRVLKPGGFLAITDFDPAVPHARPYHHREGVQSFKANYAQAFVRPGAYQLIYKHSFSHSQAYFDSNSDERVATSVLFKEASNTGDTPITVEGL
jgi:ubiquinone/menaquinone biosynthesis C-methylase UbiE